MPLKINAVPWTKLLTLAVLAFGAMIAWRYISREQLVAFIERSRNIGWLGYFLFILGYGVWCTLGLPASILSLGAAAAFGFWRALLVVFIGANFGATLGFLLARHVARDWFTNLVGRRMALAQINRAVAESGWKIVMLTRLPPISPFTIVNYAYGLTPIRLRDYVLGTAIGVIPGTTAYIYLGTILGDVAQATHRERTTLEWGILIFGFVATIVVCIYLVRLAKKALVQRSIAK